MVSVEELLDIKEEMECVIINADIITSQLIIQNDINTQLLKDMILGSQKPKDVEIAKCYFDRGIQIRDDLESELNDARDVFESLGRGYFDMLWNLYWEDE